MVTLSIVLYGIVDKSTSYSLGISIIVAVSSFDVLKNIINIPLHAACHGFRALFSKCENKSDLTSHNSAEIVTMVLTVSIVYKLLSMLFMLPITRLYAELSSFSDTSTEIILFISKIYLLYTIQSAINTTIEDILSVQRRQALVVVGLTIHSTINIVGDLLSIHFGWGLLGIYLATALAETTKVTMYLIVIRFKFIKPKPTQIKGMFCYAKDMLFYIVTQRFAQFSQNYFASNLGETSYAIYCVSASIADLVESFISSTASAFMVYVGERHTYMHKLNKDYNILYETDILKQAKCYYILNGVFYTIVCLATAYPLYLLYANGVAWNDVKYFLVIYMFGHLAYLFSNTYLGILKVYNHSKYVYKSSFYGLTFCISAFIFVYYILQSQSIIFIVIIVVIDRIFRAFYINSACRRHMNEFD